MFQPILKMFAVLETMMQGLHSFLCNLLDIVARLPQKSGSSGPTVVHALLALLIRSGGRHSCCCGYFLLQWLYSSLIMMAGVVLLSRSFRQDESIHVLVILVIYLQLGFTAILVLLIGKKPARREESGLI